MTITKLNYEVYALDYLEGTLSEETQAAMELFLLGHPEIAMELEAMSKVVPLTPDPLVTFQHKEKLLKKESKTRLVFWRRWQLGAAAAIALLLALTSLWELDFFVGQKTVAKLEQPSEEAKKEEAKEKEPVLELPNERIAKTEIDVSPTKPMIAESKKKDNKRGLAIGKKSKAQPLKKATTNIADTKIIKTQQRPMPNFYPENAIEAITRPIEVAATISEAKPENKQLTVQVVAALPLSELKKLKGTSDFKNIKIHTQQFTNTTNELLAEHTPKKRTLKSMLGKLSGDRISVSILPSFFTDKGD